MAAPMGSSCASTPGAGTIVSSGGINQRPIRHTLAAVAELSKCGGFTPSSGQFALDSPLEEAVTSEPVSEIGPNTMAYDPIPYATEQGSYFGLAGN
jgi:hypothetical protein